MTKQSVHSCTVRDPEPGLRGSSMPPGPKEKREAWLLLSLEGAIITKNLSGSLRS